MVNGGAPDDGSIADVPWASVFDPDNNFRALGAIQARGFRAASEVVDRLLKAADRTDETASVSEGDRTRADAPKPDVDRVMQTWQKLMAQVAQSIRDSVSTPDAAGPAAFDLTEDRSSGAVSIEAAGPGGSAAGEVWMHNKGAADLGKVRLRCSDLMAHDGARIEAASVRFEPDTVPMPARSSRGVTVEIDIADDVAPGHYRGTLMADGHAEVWLPVVLIVASAVR